jgi:hypothetical protein
MWINLEKLINEKKNWVRVKWIGILERQSLILFFLQTAA